MDSYKTRDQWNYFIQPVMKENVFSFNCFEAMFLVNPLAIAIADEMKDVIVGISIHLFVQYFSISSHEIMILHNSFVFNNIALKKWLHTQSNCTKCFGFLCSHKWIHWMLGRYLQK